MFMITQQNHAGNTEVIQNHENENVRFIGKGKARHRKFKRLKLGGRHVYDCSSV
jgi:hypothetical protein